tara:strand:- start:33834 stop:34940 length:1107 start_codon:yes stop_codon:yes gene_type:complete
MENIFKKLYPKAKKYLDDKKRLKKLLSKATDKSSKLKDKDTRDEIKEDVKFSVSLLKDWSNNEYREIPKKSILSIIAAMLYFVIPTDLIPDFILGTGFLDDAAVLSYMFSIIKNDLEQYKLFKESVKIKIEMKENIFSGFSNMSKHLDSKIHSSFLIFLSYFIKNDFELENFRTYIKRNEATFKLKTEDQTSFSLLIDKNKIARVTTNSSFLLNILTAYSVTHYKKNDEDFFKEINDIVKMSYHNEEVEEISALYASMVKKIMNGEKDKLKFLLQHNYDFVSFKSKRAFELGLGSYIKNYKTEDKKNNISDSFEIIAYYLYQSNSFYDIINGDIEKELPKSYLIFLSAILFNVQKEEDYLTKIQYLFK